MESLNKAVSFHFRLSRHLRSWLSTVHGLGKAWPSISTYGAQSAETVSEICPQGCRGEGHRLALVERSTTSWFAHAIVGLDVFTLGRTSLRDVRFGRTSRKRCRRLEG